MAYSVAWRRAVALKLKGVSALSVEGIKRLSGSAFVSCALLLRKLAWQEKGNPKGWM